MDRTRRRRYAIVQNGSSFEAASQSVMAVNKFARVLDLGPKCLQPGIQGKAIVDELSHSRNTKRAYPCVMSENLAQQFGVRSAALQMLIYACRQPVCAKHAEGKRIESITNFQKALSVTGVVAVELPDVLPGPDRMHLRRLPRSLQYPYLAQCGAAEQGRDLDPRMQIGTEMGVGVRDPGLIARK